LCNVWDLQQGPSHSTAQARQLLGSRGLSQHVPLGGSTLGQAVVALQTLVTAQEEPSVGLLAAVLIQVRLGAF